jgi:hypothetical protein
MQGISSRRVDEAGRRLAEAFSPVMIDALLKDAKSLARRLIVLSSLNRRGTSSMSGFILVWMC